MGQLEQPTSAEVRRILADEGRPVLLAFSCGKDALASWLAMRDAGITEIYPYYLYYVPGLEFVQRSVDRYSELFGVQVRQYPHPSLFRWLNNLVFQAPERCASIEAAQFPNPTYTDMLVMLREEYGLAADTWVADGVRAADSPVRRISFQTHGVMKPKSGKVSVIWDWRKRDVMGRIEQEGFELPPDYQWFGRSFDGIDYRFLEPLSRHAPDDYQRVLDWFPLARLELFRRDVII
jgi:3'-phosphoadenosine 5'-phosphosulfate sulfotransferase (PAPS reductase)/FAD synthetase